MTTTTEATPDHLSGHVTTRIGHNQKDLIEGATGPWEVVIGLEVHAQVTSEAKLFSGASSPMTTSHGPVALAVEGEMVHAGF